MTQAKSDKASRQPALKLVWFFLKPYKAHVVVLFVLASLIGFLETVTVAAIYPVVSLGLNVEAGQENALLLLIAKVASIIPIQDAFISYCVLVIFLAIIVFLIKAFNLYFSVHLGASVVTRVKERMFVKQLQADYQHFLDERQGGLVYTTTIATGVVWSLVVSVAKIMSEIVIMVSLFILLVSMNWKGTILVGLVAGGYYVVTQYIGTRVSYTTGLGRAESFKKEHIILNEVFTGIKQIRIFLMENYWTKGFSDAVRKYFYHVRRGKVWSELPGHSLWLMLFSLIALVAILLRVQNPDSLTLLLPLFGTFAFAMLRLLSPIVNFGSLRMELMESLPNAELTYDALQTQFSTIQDGNRELKTFNQNIQLDHVFFTHRGRSKTIRDVTVTLEKGKTTAIVGPSGEGKTTIVDLLLRLYDPDKGKIRIDGINLKEYKLSSWLSKIGLVSQDTFVFHDTISRNISFGLDGYSDEQIVRAAKSANAHDFILEFPQGYDTIVGERGMKLSGGQKQRIAIARAIMKKPAILILDEATSALDNISEALVQDAISKISKDRTVLVIAHRLSTIIGADKIVVLERGRVMEEGIHQELMEKRGAYWNLYKRQENTESLI